MKQVKFKNTQRSSFLITQSVSFICLLHKQTFKKMGVLGIVTCCRYSGFLPAGKLFFCTSAPDCKTFTCFSPLLPSCKNKVFFFPDSVTRSLD